MLSLKLALAYFRRRKLRAILTTLSVAVAIAALVALQSLNGSIDYAGEELATLLGGKAQLVVKAPQGGMNNSLLETVQKIAGVKSAVPFVQNAAQVKELPGFTTILGIVPGEDEKIRNYRVIQGRMPAKDLHEITVPEELLQRIHGQLGDTWHIQTMQGMQDFSLVGILEDNAAVQANNGAVVFMPMTTAQKAFGLEGKLSYISVVLQNPNNILSVQESLQKSLGNSAEVLSPSGRNETTDKVLRFDKSLNNVYGFMGLFLALYVMYLSMRVAIAEQRRQLGILRALGWRRWEIHKLIIIQATLIGVIGSSLGLFFGNYLAQVLLSTVSDTLREMFKLSILHIHYTAYDYGLIWLTGVILCLISAWIPAWKAAGIAPIEAMNNQYSNIQKGYSWLRVAAGFALMINSIMFLSHGNNISLQCQVAIGSMFVGAAVLMPPILLLFLEHLEPWAEKFFGLPGRLGVGFLRRNPRRTISTGMPILLGFAVAFGFLGILASVNLTLTNWVNDYVSPDLTIGQELQTSSSNLAGLPEDLVQRVRNMDGVRVAAGLRTTGFRWHGNPIDLLTNDMEWLQLSNPPVLEPGKEKAVDALQSGGQIWISQAMALKYGLQIGQKLSIPTPIGTIDFPIAAIVKDFDSYNGTVYMNRQDYIRYWNDHSVDYVWLGLKPNVSSILMRDKLDESLKSDYRVQVVLGSEDRDNCLKYTRSFIKIFNLVILVILLVAAVGTANSMLISVQERAREIGTLRSVGLTHKQIKGMFMIEIGSLLLAGIILSIPVAVCIQSTGIMFDKNVVGWVLDVAIPWFKLIIFIIAMGIIVGLSALYPISMASRVEPVQVLRSE